MACPAQRIELINVQTIEIISLLLGSLVGVILAFTGAGGAIIAVPLLVFGLHLAIADAGPIALFAVSVSAAIGALLALRMKAVRYRAASLIAFTGALVSPLGIFVARKIPDTILTILFAVVLAYVALRMFRQSAKNSDQIENPERSPAPCQLDSSSGRFIWTAPCFTSLVMSGISAGFLSGLLGVGGGFIIVPALRKATDLHMRSIVSTSLAVIAIVSAAGVVSAVIIGEINWSIAIPFAIGSVAAMLLVSAFSDHFSGPGLQRGFAVVAGCVSVGMIVKAIMVLTG